MRGGLVAIGYLIMILGGSLFVSTRTQPVEFLGITIGETRKESYYRFGTVDIPLNTIGAIAGLFGLITFITGFVARAPTQHNR